MEINLGDMILGTDENGKSVQIKVSSIAYEGGETIYREAISHYVNGHWKGHHIKIKENDVIGIYKCESCGREAVRKGHCYCHYCKEGRIKLYKFEEINAPNKIKCIKCDNPEF